MKKETLAVAWFDDGMVDGKFMEGVVDTLMNSGVEFCGFLRSHGFYIAQQREMVVNRWYDSNRSDWLLWLDSDIMITPEKFIKLWKRRDAKEIPLLTGVYFTSNEPEQPLMKPSATVYEFAEAEFGIGIRRLDPLPKDTFMKVGAAGMGFCLMHRSVITRIKEALPGVPFFTEVGANKQFTGEDIYFFAVVNKAGIPLWCDTGATVGHMKRFNMDENYYDAFGRGKGYATEYPNWFSQTAEENFKSQLTPYAGKFSLRFLQIGAFTGDASVWLVDNILTQKNSILEDVDTWAGSGEHEKMNWDWADVERVYDSRIAFRPNVIKHKMDSREYLRSVEAPTFDFIYIDGDHTAENVRQDAVLAWRLLKPGGIIAFDDYLWQDPRGIEFQPGRSIDTFVGAVKEESDVLLSNSQVWLKKKKRSKR